MARDITKLHPKLQNLANELVIRCHKIGLEIKITDCIRDLQEQNDCVARGTSSVKYPHSHHNWGTAFDFCRNDGKGAYNNDGDFFQNVGAIGQSLGLEWGGSWVSPIDMPHFQMADWGTSTKKLIELYGTPDTFKKTWNINIPTPTPKAEIKKGDFENMTKQEKEEYIKNLYIKNLGRIADDEGLNYWVNQINENSKLIELESKFVRLEECRKYLVKCAYRNIFKRDADNEGLNYWSEWIKTHNLTELYNQFKSLKNKGNK